MNTLVSSLRSLGFSEGEIRTYLCVFEFGPQTAIEIAKKTNLARQTVYDAISGLKKRGLMTMNEEGKKVSYAAEPPEKLLAFAKKRESDFKQQIGDLERIIPSLELQMGGNERPVVRMYQGKEGIRAMISDLSTAQTQNSYEIVDGPAMLNVLTDEDLAPFRKAIKSKNIVIKAILHGVPRPVPQSVPGHRKFLPKEDGNFKSYISVVGDIVSMSTYTGKLFSLVIKNKAIADAMRVLFKYAHKAVPGKEV
jgi:sugar-specific transcriptional regulator TrmB